MQRPRAAPHRARIHVPGATAGVALNAPFAGAIAASGLRARSEIAGTAVDAPFAGAPNADGVRAALDL
jgi:hypothetical protein